MFKVAFVEMWKIHSLDFSLMLLVALISTKLVCTEITYSGTFRVGDIITAGFFGVAVVVYPIVTFLKFYFDEKLKFIQKEIDDGKV